MRILFVLLTVLVMAGCQRPPHKPADGAFQNTIAEDATAYAKAYADASNSLLLLNVLYAKDGLPRQYVGLKDVTSTRTVKRALGATIGSVPFGNPEGAVWGVGGASYDDEQTAQPNYGIAPLVGDDLSKAVYRETPDSVFAGLWNANYPRDILIRLMVRKVHCVSKSCSGESYTSEEIDRYRSFWTEYIKDDTNICFHLSAGICGDATSELHYDVEPIPIGLSTVKKREAVEKRLTLFKLAKEAGFSLAIDGEAQKISEQTKFVISQAAANTGLYASFPSEMSAKLGHRSTWRLELRSIDEIISFLGNMVREKGLVCIDDDETKSCDPRKGSLFNIVQKDNDKPPSDPNSSVGRLDFWAADVQYQGDWYYAGRAKTGNDAQARDDTAAVLAILRVLLEVNRSPESLTLPTLVGN